MSYQLLITPNVIINFLLLYEQDYKNQSGTFFLEKIIYLSKENNCSVFMTDIDLEVSWHYYKYFESLLSSLNSRYNVNVSELQKQISLIKILGLLKEYFQIVQEYRINEDILNIAKSFLNNNPSDAIRLASAVVSEKLSNKPNIDAIITWEPSNFCQNVDNYYAIRSRGYGEIKVFIDSESNNAVNTEISKRIYTPNHFLFSRYVDLKINTENNTTFKLVNINLETSVNSDEEAGKNIVKVTIDYENKLYAYTYNSQSETISALLLAIYICIKKKCLKYDVANRKLISAKLIKDIVFSITPARNDNKKVQIDISIINQDLQVTQIGSDVLWTVAKAYVRLINHVVNVAQNEFGLY